MAKEGDRFAMKLCMDRYYPARRERRLKLDLSEIHTAGDVHTALTTVVREAAQGNITTGQAEHIANVLEFGRRSIETHELANRVTEVENKVKEKEESDERRACITGCGGWRRGWPFGKPLPRASSSRSASR